MLQKSLYLIVCLLILKGPVRAAEDFDAFIRDHCGSACNGEKDECTQCYNEAIDMNDQANPVSPEIPFDLNYNQGRLKLVF